MRYGRVSCDRFYQARSGGLMEVLLCRTAFCERLLGSAFLRVRWFATSDPCGLVLVGIDGFGENLTAVTPGTLEMTFETTAASTGHFFFKETKIAPSPSSRISRTSRPFLFSSELTFAERVPGGGALSIRGTGGSSGSVERLSWGAGGIGLANLVYSEPESKTERFQEAWDSGCETSTSPVAPPDMTA